MKRTYLQFILLDVLMRGSDKAVAKVRDKYLYGQYFSRPDVADLIIGFCVKDSRISVLDPSCGNGIFLNRAGHRLRHLNLQATAADVLTRLWGIEIDESLVKETKLKLWSKNHAAEVTKGCPHILHADFFDLPSTDTSLYLPRIGAIIGNPPYTRQEKLDGSGYGPDYKKKLSEVIERHFHVKLNARAGIYAYFLIHATHFLDEHPPGRLGFIMLRSWLDVDFGQTLKRFILDHYKIVAIIQSLGEKWFQDAQMIPCIVILELELDPVKRAHYQAKFIQLKCGLDALFPQTPKSHTAFEDNTNWEGIEKFVDLVEAMPFSPGGRGENDLTIGKLHIRVSDALRIVTIAQNDLNPEKKWGVFLNAPLVYFKILEDPASEKLLVPLGEVLQKITPGIKSGANNFFYLPNSHISITNWNHTSLLLQGKGPLTNGRFEIEKSFLSPILVKFKVQRKIYISKNDAYCVTVNAPKAELTAKGAKVLQYIKFGEQNPPAEPYAKRSSCINRKTVTPCREWYQVTENPIAPLLHFEITTNREVTFFVDPMTRDPILLKPFLCNYGFYQLFPAKESDSEVILAILNSTFGYLMVEFGGRYIENRDGTISNETRIGDLQKMLIIDPARISPELREKLVELVHQLGRREVQKIWDEFNQPDRKALDVVVFTEILGISHTLVQELYATLAETALQRNKKKE